MSSRFSRVFGALAVSAALAAPLGAQTIDDGIMLAKQELLAGNHYSYERWDQYWEGALKRSNGNIGTITTRMNILSGNYGVTNRLNVIGMVPYVWTNASQGVLHGIQGFQDLTVAAKYRLFDTAPFGHGLLRAIAVGTVGVPMTHYNAELLPLSIGMGSTRVSSRGTLFYQAKPGWFANGSSAYTWRSSVTLDRPYFYTADAFTMSDQVDMPNAFDYVVAGGYMKGVFMAQGSWSQQRTLGGGDIRRQDMPFVSNRMNFSKGGAMVMAPVPKLRTFIVELGISHVFAGRNVGQGTAIMGGLLYKFHGSTTR